MRLGNIVRSGYIMRSGNIVHVKSGNLMRSGNIKRLNYTCGEIGKYTKIMLHNEIR